MRFYEKNVGKTKKEMINFLVNHERYYTMNSWNRSDSWGNNIKIYNLGLEKELEEKAYERAYMEYDSFWDIEYRMLKEEFEEETGYTIGTNGRSGGYLVMYECEWEDGKEKVWCGRSVDDYSEYDYSEMTKEELKEIVERVKQFDKTCDKIREAYIESLKKYYVGEEKYTIIKTRKVLKEEKKEELKEAA